MPEDEHKGVCGCPRQGVQKEMEKEEKAAGELNYKNLRKRLARFHLQNKAILDLGFVCI